MDYKSLGYLFKNKLSQRKFEMEDAYWEDAEQLIIESNKRRQKKRVLFSLVAILLIVTALMGVFDYNSENGEFR